MQGSGSYSKHTSSDQATKSLKNVLDLERKLEFNDRAVMGGLDRFINHITPQLGWIRDVEPLKGTSYAALARTETSMGLCNYGSAWQYEFGPTCAQKVKVKNRIKS